MYKQRRRRKPKVEKKKTKLSQEYVKTEAEVKSLIRAQKDSKKNVINTIDEEITFFTEIISDQVNDAEVERETSERESSTAAASSETPATQPASSYIQIEEIIQPIQKIKSIKLYFINDLLYIPSSKESSDLSEFEENKQRELLKKYGLHVEQKLFRVKNSNNIRMINRFVQEGLFNLISSSNCLKNQRTIVEDNFPRKLYRTECMKKFVPYLSVSSLFQHQNAENFTGPKRHLKILFKKLQFLEHPLQTEEHCLAIKLEELYHMYTEKLNNNHIAKMTVELNTVREIIRNMIEEATEDNLQKLENYMIHAKYLRNSLHREELTIKSLTKSILDTWLSLKTLRKRQGINWTNIKLTVQVEDTDKKQDEILWEKRFQTELNEIFREEFEAYYREKRRRKYQKQKEKIEDSVTILPLHKPDTEIIKLSLRETLMKCTRLPGEPKVTLIKGYLNEIPKQPLEKIKEYYFKIYFDNQLVGSTKTSKLKTDFKLNFNETFAILLERNRPENMKIELYEKLKIPPDKKIANMFLPILKLSDYSHGSAEMIEFSSKKLKISGRLKLLIYLDNTFESDTDMSNIPDRSVTNQQNIGIKINRDTLFKWYENELLNPLDPDSFYLAENLTEIKRNSIEKFQIGSSSASLKQDEEENCFIFNEELLAFCSEEDIMINPRYKMLRSRYKNDMKYKDFRFVPLFENEVEEINEERIIEEADWMNPIDVHKHKGKKYLQKLYDVICNHCNLLNKNEETSNLLIGDEIPTFRSIIQAIMGYFSSNRSLTMNPPKQNRFSVNVNDFLNFNIFINVIRATGIPVRNFITIDKRRSSSASETYQAIKYSNVRPYISVIYRDQTIRTTTTDGSNPTWNEQLTMKITGRLSEFRDDIKFILFDEYVEDLLNDDTTRGMEVYQRIHMNWLGELRIPLSTILQKQKIEGVFELNTPKVIVGYSRPSLDPTNGTIQIENVPEIRESVYLSLYISIEPEFELSGIKTSCLECSELKEVKLFIQEWCIEAKENYREYFIDPLISLANGKRVCATRLIESIPLPFESSTENIKEILRRYVSLIPVLKIINPCMGLTGIWLNNEIILDTTWASPKDLGVLLTCFYLSCGIRAYLILGVGLLYNETTFVLIKENSVYNIIDPMTSKIYSSGDIYCPLEKVYCVVSSENVYCNIQSETRASMIDFNIDNTSLWIPLFNKNNPAPIGGVHKLNYNFKMEYNINDLRRNIERKIMKKISSWRSNRKTIWNRAISNVLYNILHDLENDVILERPCDNYSEEITQKIQAYKLFGFTLNFSYTNLSTISERIKSTGIHLNTDRNVEFSVAVHIKQYPNNILSVWLFLVSAVPN